MSHGYVNIPKPVFPYFVIGKDRGGYIICIGVGLLRCSFRLVGQCESLYFVERATGNGLHVFFVYVGINKIKNIRMLNRGR